MYKGEFGLQLICIIHNAGGSINLLYIVQNVRYVSFLICEYQGIIVQKNKREHSKSVLNGAQWGHCIISRSIEINSSISHSEMT